MFRTWNWILILMLVILVSGCGERQEISTYYYSPGWLKDGKVVFIKGLQSVKKDAIGTQLGSIYTESLMTMSSAGTSEALLFDVTGVLPYQLNSSPATDYLAYLDDLRNNLFDKIVIRNVASGTHTGLEKVELRFSPGIKSFDWSPDGTRLVYCTTKEVHTISVSGTADALVTAEANLEFVSWKYGGRIAFVHASGANKILSFINANGAARTNLAAAASVDKPQISSANTNEVYGIAGGSYTKVDVSAGTPATSEVLASFKGELPRLAPTADKVIYSKTGEQSGIYLLDIATKVETKEKR